MLHSGQNNSLHFARIFVSSRVVQVGLDLRAVLLPQAPKCWDQRHVPPYLADCAFREFSKGD